MTSRQARTQRREAERKAKKLEYKQQRAAVVATAEFVAVGAGHAPPTLEEEFSPELIAEANATRERVHARARINRENAQHSTGPRSSTGKVASSRNSLQHGLASGQIIMPGEDPSEFEALLNALIAEHQPSTPTEQLLVQEMAQSYWLTQRALRLQNCCFSDSGVDEKRLALFLRYQTTHDRAFHKALNTLLKLQKERGRASKIGFVSQSAGRSAPDTGFVSQNELPFRAPSVSDGSSPEFVRQNHRSEAA